MSWQFESIDNALNEPELDDYCEGCSRYIGLRHSHLCEQCEHEAKYELGMNGPTDQ